MRSFTFFIPGQPRGKGRSRSVMGRAGHYPDPRTAREEKSIGWIAHQAMQGMRPLEGPIHLTVKAVSLYPASWSKRRREREYWKTSRPDLDNIVKLIKDGLNRVAWLDDAQVAKMSPEKRYGDTEGIFVTVSELTDCPTRETVFA